MVASITRTQEYKQMDALNRAFARAVDKQPKVEQVNLTNANYHFSVDSTSDPDVSYWVTLPVSDEPTLSLRGATFICQHAERHNNDPLNPCCHVAADFIYHHNLYERFARGETLTDILASLSNAPVADRCECDAVIPDGLKHCENCYIIGMPVVEPAPDCSFEQPETTQPAKEPEVVCYSCKARPARINGLCVDCVLWEESAIYG